MTNGYLELLILLLVHHDPMMSSYELVVIVGDTARHQMPVQLQLHDHPAVSHAQERK